MISSLLIAQEEIADFQDFTVADGLSSTNVITFFQDSRGVIWIGTSYGLNSYDGNTFRSYTKEDDGICHNYIQTIAEDGKGNLWIRAGDYGRQDFCFCILDPITEKVYSIEEYTGQPCPFDPFQTWLNPNYKGVFLLTEHQADNRVQFYEVKEDKIEKGFSCIYSNTLDEGTGNTSPFHTIKLNEETYLFAAPKESFKEEFHNDFFHLNAAGEIHKHRPESTDLETALLYWTDGQHYYYSYYHNYESFKNNGKTIPLSYYKDGKFIAQTSLIHNKEYPPFLIKNKIYKFYPDRIEKYRPSKDSLIQEQSISFKKKRLLSGINFTDKGGNIWFYGLNEITKLSFRPKNFKLSLDNKFNDTDVSRPIRGIVSSKNGVLYIGELQGLNIKNSSSENNQFEFIKELNYSGNLGLHYDNGMLWSGKEHNGLSSLNLKTKEFYNYGTGLIWQPYKSPDGSIWAGAGEGLFRLDTVKKDLIPFRNYDGYEALQKSSIYAFHLNEKGTWLSTSSGVYLIDLIQEEILAHYSDTETGDHYIPANHITHIHEDKAGIFWLATKGQGLIHWNLNTGKSEQLTKKNTGLSHNVIYAVYEDNYGNLWLPSDYGLNCLNKASRQVSLYLKDDGLPHNEFNTISHHQDKEGNLYFGTVNGMIEFHPKDFNHQQDEVPFIVTAAHRIDQKTDSIINMTKSVLDNHSLTIRPSDKAADFSFALLDYKKTEGNQYSYKIEGYRDEWTYQKDGAVRISGLPYGNYQLHLRGKASGSNTWINYTHPIQIKVAKPFYLQWWFIFSALSALIGLVFYIIKRNTSILLKRQEELEVIVEERTEEIREQAEELKELDKVKSNFFANISHELRTPLTLILGPLSYLLDSPEEWKKEHIQKQLLVMQRNGKSLMQLIEEILDLSKLEANKLELMEEGTPIVQFFEHIFFVFEPQFQNQGLNYEMRLDFKGDLYVLMDRTKMEKVMNNFLSNAIKFTPKGGKITLDVKGTENQLKIQVTDTGKGIHPKDLPHIFDRFYQSKQADQKLYGGTGIGLALVNEFAQLMGGKAYAESTLGVGSRFFFEIPKKEVDTAKILEMVPDEVEEKEVVDSIGTDFTILVVEDNEDMRNFIFQLLQKKYKKVLLAENGSIGLKVLEESGRNIDLIVSDVMMPEIDGLTMLKEIKSHPEWYRIPVVMLTALAAERDKLNALTIGVDDYLTKPFSVSELMIRVQNLLYNFNQRIKWQKEEEEEEEQSEEAIIKSVQHSVTKGTTDDTASGKKGVSQKDKEWVEGLQAFIEKSLGMIQLDVKILSDKVFLSPRQLARKLKTITGLSPAKFIKEVQLQAARKTLENGKFITISEVAHRNGFEHQTTFSTLFKKRFGKLPSEYMK